MADKFVNDGEARKVVALAQSGNAAAAVELIERNHLMLTKMASIVARRGSSFEDLYSVGKLAIVNQIPRIDIYSKLPIGMVLMRAVETAMKRYADADRNVPIAVNAAETKRKVHAVIERMIAEGKEVTIDSVALEAHITPKMAKRLMRIDVATVSMNLRVEGDEGEGSEFGDTIIADTPSPSQIAENSDIICAMLKAVEQLNDTEKTVIEYRFGINGKKRKNLEEIAVIFNRSTEWVRQTVTRTLAKIKQNME